MKTIEEKAKAYDKAIKIAMNNPNCFVKDVIEDIFPELKESEDERIRKELIAEVKEQIDCIPAPDCRDKEDEKALKRLNKWLVWLEKQGRLMTALQISNSRIAELVEEKYNLEEKLEKQGEQKPAWSEEDERNLYYWLDNNKSIGNDKYRWLLSLKDRVQPQPKQEWSEEDEEILYSIINDIEIKSGRITLAELKESYTKQINWLKSIKDRFTWKPSEEQMRVLDLAIRCGINGGTTEETTLISLFNDLKKLKE